MPALPPGLLLCPVCRQTLARADRSLACGAGHRFDAARQGYVNLLTGKGSPFEGDGVEMVEAREQFLGSGAFDPLRALIVESALRAVPRPAIALDAGAGTGSRRGGGHADRGRGKRKLPGGEDKRVTHLLPTRKPAAGNRAARYRAAPIGRRAGRG